MVIRQSIDNEKMRLFKEGKSKRPLKILNSYTFLMALLAVWTLSPVSLCAQFVRIHSGSLLSLYTFKLCGIPF